MFAMYLDIQKGIIMEELPEEEVKGRWKSFIRKWYVCRSSVYFLYVRYWGSSISSMMDSKLIVYYDMSIGTAANSQKDGTTLAH